MSDLSIGDVIQDNDPRMPGRKLTIAGFEAGLRTTHQHETFAVCNMKYRGGIRINVKRIFTDGKPRRYGFNRVKEFAA